MKQGLFIVAAALLVAYLAVASLFAARGVQEQLVDRAQASLRAVGLDSVQIRADGRELVLSGEVADDTARDRARIAALDVTGVVRVVDRLDTVRLAHIRVPPRLELRLDGDVLIVSGDLPNDDIHGQIITFAEAFFPTRSVDNRVRVLDDIDDPRWINSLPFLIRVIGERVQDPRFVVEDGIARLDGTVASRRDLEYVRDSVSDLLAALEVDVRIDLDADAEPEPADVPEPAAAPSAPGPVESTVGTDGAAPDTDTAEADPPVPAGPEQGELVAIEEMDAAGPPPEEVAILQPAVRPAVGREDPLAAFELQDAIDELMLGHVISFEVGSTDVTEASEPIIAEFAELLLERGIPVGYHVEVQGHTDSQGQHSYNLTLSQDRAEAVLERLAAIGVGREHLRSVGYADAHPIADNDTVEGRAMNRRIQFVIQEDD